MKIEYREEFEYCDLLPSEIQSARDYAKALLASRFKKERKKGARIYSLVAWIEREVWVMQERLAIKKALGYGDCL